MTLTKPQTPPPQRPPLFETPPVDIVNNLDAESFLTPAQLNQCNVQPSDPRGTFVAVQIDTDEDLKSANNSADLQLVDEVAFDVEERHG